MRFRVVARFPRIPLRYIRATNYDNIAGTSFEDSPLVETKHALAVGFGVSWVFRQSDAMVAR